MLINTPYKAGDTVSMKLSSGEEIIARLVEEGTDFYKVAKPLMVAVTQQGLGLAPFMFTVEPDAEMKLAVSNVLTISKTEKEMASQYVQNTTGLTV